MVNFYDSLIGLYVLNQSQLNDLFVGFYDVEMSVNNIYYFYLLFYSSLISFFYMHILYYLSVNRINKINACL